MKMASATEIDSLLQRQTITIPEAGRVLGIGRDSAYRAAHRGQIPTLTLGRRVIVPTAQLRKLLEGHVLNGGPDAA
jgi:excisionase family DNA binding protein